MRGGAWGAFGCRSPHREGFFYSRDQKGDGLGFPSPIPPGLGAFGLRDRGSEGEDITKVLVVVSGEEEEGFRGVAEDVEYGVDGRGGMAGGCCKAVGIEGALDVGNPEEGWHLGSPF